MLAVIFGGKSCEHNISLITGKQVLNALAGRKGVLPILMGRDGGFYIGKNLFDEKVKRTPVMFLPPCRQLVTVKGKKVAVIDAAVLATHGFGGEDGCLQGLLTLCGIPFTGSSVSASAVGMDKLLMKKVFERDFLPVLPYSGLGKAAFLKDKKAAVKRLTETLPLPLIVKPASLGSSIGISVARTESELSAALEAGFLWDNFVVAETLLEGFTEYNAAVLGDKDNLTVSEIERPITAKEFLSFEDKYVAKGKAKTRDFPAAVPSALKQKIKDYAVRAFRSVGASGVARVDFLYDNTNGRLFVNEINTVPGALSNYLFPDLTFADLIDRLIAAAQKNKAELDGRKYAYESVYKIGAMGK